MQFQWILFDEMIYRYRMLVVHTPCCKDVAITLTTRITEVQEWQSTIPAVWIHVGFMVGSY